MNIVALDGSGLVAGIAVMTEEKLLAEYSVNYKKTHSQTLLPMLDEVLKMIELEPKDIDYIAVANGPGSFTGLRICASTAKGLGLALNKPLVAVPSLDALAYNFEGNDKIICPIMDARRNQVYTATYTFVKKSEFETINPDLESEKLDDESEITKLNKTEIQPENSDTELKNPEMELKTLDSACAEDIHDTIQKVCAHAKELGKEVIFLGDGTIPYAKIIAENMNVAYTIAPTQLLMQRAGSLARAALKMIEKNQVTTAMELVPEYFRLSQAERERLEKQKGSL